MAAGRRRPDRPLPERPLPAPRSFRGSGAGLDGGGEDALDADAVAAHDGHDLLAVAVEDGAPMDFGVLVAELEDVADLDGFAEAEGLLPMGSSSPSRMLRMSAVRVGVKSRPGVMLRKW